MAKYSQVVNLNKSGKNDADRLLDAHKLFQQASHTDPNKQYVFHYMSCYTILKDSPKWQTQHLQKTKSKPTPTIVTMETSSLSSATIDNDEAMAPSVSSAGAPARPLGNKQAKVDKTQTAVMERNVAAGEKLTAAINHKTTVTVTLLESQAAVKRQMFDQKQRLAAEKNNLRTISLLMQRNPNCNLAQQLLDKHAKAAIRRLQSEEQAASSNTDNITSYELNVNNIDKEVTTEEQV